MDMPVTTEYRPRGRTITARQLDAWIASGEPRSEIDVMITPQIARSLLKRNVAGETNRIMNDEYVRRTIAIIRAGDWENTGEPIIVSDEGILNDGQHRLKAIVEMDEPCVMDLRFGIKRRAFANTNSGRRRSGADALTIAQINNAANVAAMVRLVICYERGLPGALKGRVSNGEIVAGARRWPDMQEAHAITQGIGKPFRNAATNVTAFFALRTMDDTDMIDRFFAILRFGEGSKNHPAHQLREYLRGHVLTQGNDTTKRAQVFAACIRAWNAYRNGAPNSGKINLHWREGTPFPVAAGLKL